MGKLDRLAKERGMSRQEFLHEQLELIAVYDKLESYRERVDRAMKLSVDAILEQGEVLGRLETKYREMVQLIALVSDINLSDIEDVVTNNVRK